MMPWLSVAVEQGLLAMLCGSFVSFSLGLVGGGGSILAVPLLFYMLRVGNVHLAIGTSAVAVAINAFLNLIPHARAGHVHWRAALTFSASGMVGAAFGSSVGKRLDSHHLMVYFALLMCVVALLMLRPRAAAAMTPSIPVARLYGRLLGTGLGTGSLSGFFGIGGGFLVVPGLVLTGRMQIIEAIGTSLFAVGAFGLTTAVNHSISRQVDWSIAAVFVAGGILGGLGGAYAARRLAHRHRALNGCFSAIVIFVATYILYQTV